MSAMEKQLSLQEERNHEGVFLVQQEQVFCHDGDKWFLVAPAVRNTVELPFYEKGLEIPHAHHVMLDGIKPALHPDVAHKDSHAAVFPERHIELPDTEVQLFQKVIVILAPRQVIRVRLPHIFPEYWMMLW